MSRVKIWTYTLLGCFAVGALIAISSGPNDYPAALDGMSITTLCGVADEIERKAMIAERHAGVPKTPSAMAEFLQDPARMENWRAIEDRMIARTATKFESTHNRNFDAMWIRWTKYIAANGYPCKG